MKKLYIRGGILLLIIIILLVGLSKKEVKKEIKENPKKVEVKVEEPVIEEVVEEAVEEVIEVERTYTARITSYWENDDCNSEDMTASGKSSKDFQLNDKGWYTWNGKLVVATASTRLGRTNQRTYRLYDELTLIINGERYDAIVLDVCGACMRDNRIDLYVKDKQHMIDQRIEVVER